MTNELPNNNKAMKPLKSPEALAIDGILGDTIELLPNSVNPSRTRSLSTTPPSEEKANYSFTVLGLLTKNNPPSNTAKSPNGTKISPEPLKTIHE